MVPFWVPVIIRHLLFRGTQKGTIILTTTHMAEQKDSPPGDPKQTSPRKMPRKQQLRNRMQLKGLRMAYSGSQKVGTWL